MKFFITVFLSIYSFCFSNIYEYQKEYQIEEVFKDEIDLLYLDDTFDLHNFKFFIERYGHLYLFEVSLYHLQECPCYNMSQ